MLQVWFLDEMRYGMKGFLRRVWAVKGSRPTHKRQNGFKSGYVFGAVNPLTGDRVGLAFTSVDTEIVNLFLGMVSTTVDEAIHIILIMDNAGYPDSKEMKIPANITILPLPSYSPELNPVERLWKWLKDHYLCNRIFKNLDHILKAGSDAWGKLTNLLVQSICSTEWLENIFQNDHP